MKFDVVKAPLKKPLPDLRVAKRVELPIGGYSYRLVPTKGFAPKPMQAVIGARYDVGAVVEAPRETLSITIKDDDQSAEEEPKGPDMERHGEIPGEIRSELAKGGSILVGTHVAMRGGEALAAAMVANQYGIKDQALTDTLTTIIKEGGADVGGLEAAGNAVKILVFTLTLFGIGYKLLEWFYGKSPPTWAVWVMSAINVSVGFWFALWLLELGPYESNGA